MAFALFCIALAAIYTVWDITSRRSADKHPARPSAPPDVAAIRLKAEHGDAPAQVQLARLYAKGEGVTNSYREAARWYRIAATNGNSDAQAALGELYEAGQGVPKDMTEALKWYQLAAGQNNAGAQYTLGFLYEAGHGVPQNHVEAAKWFRLAAEQGDALSQYDLGQRYDLGVGVAVDRVEALKWLLLAAAQGQPDAAKRRPFVEKKMTSEQIAEAKRRAAAFVPSKSPAVAR